MYGFATTVVVIGMLVALVGLFIPLKLFGKRRLVALVVLIGLATGGIAVSESLRTPEEIEAGRRADATFAANDAAGYDRVESDPEDFIQVETTFEANGGLMVSGTLTNTSNFRIMNVRLRCEQFGQTGKRLDRESITIAQHVPANGNAEFGPLAVGYADQQVAAVYCKATDADIVPGTAASPAP